MITIGIDPHKSSLTAVARDPSGNQLGQRRLAVTAQTTSELLGWAAPWPDRQWAVEGATGLGRGVAQRLAAHPGETVLDVPATLAARARLLGSGSARKSDVTDAASVAAVAQHNRRLNQVQAEDHTTILRLLTERRDDLVAERTRAVNRLHVLLRDLHPGGAGTGLATDAAAGVLRGIRPLTAVDSQRKTIARALLVDLRRLDAAVKTMDKEVRDAVTASGSTLTQIHGLGAITAAKILALTGDVRRSPPRSTSPATPAQPRSTSLAATKNTTGSPAAATVNSTRRSTSWRSVKPATPAPGGSTTSASSPRRRLPTKRAAASNAGYPTSSTAGSSPTSDEPNALRLDTQRRS